MTSDAMTEILVTPVALQSPDSPGASTPLGRMRGEFPQTALWNDSADPAELSASIGFGAVGATCNPVIALTCLRAEQDAWHRRIGQIAVERPTATEHQIGWQLVEELSVSAARLLQPVFEASGGRNGRLSMQTDPRLHRDPAALVAQAERFNSLAPNIIVKIPATQIGLRAIEEATYRGIAINATVSFTVAQAIAVAEAIERGFDRRSAEGLPEVELGSVATIMGGRLDDWLKTVADREQMLLTPGVLDWAGVAALKRAHALFTERGYRTRVLSAAFRNKLQVTELIGGDLVISPPFAWQERINANVAHLPSRIDSPVDPAIIEELTDRLPDFTRAYEPDGMTPEEFENFGATRATLRQFLTAAEDLDNLVRDVLVPAP